MAHFELLFSWISSFINIRQNKLLKLCCMTFFTIVIIHLITIQTNLTFLYKNCDTAQFLTGSIKYNLIQREDVDNYLKNKPKKKKNNSLKTSLNKFPWHKRPDKFLFLNENIVYKKFNIPRATKPERINMIFIVSSAPSRVDRRDAIRQTWWKQCKSTSKLTIKCVFLTDWKDPRSNGIELFSEAENYGDVHFQNLTGGYDFGKRFLYHMVWAMQNFNFDYFVRVDDDYFLCMKRFLSEIPMPPKKLYHWGWVHCNKDEIRPDESIVLLSRDLIEIFLGQDPKKILCNRWADQMIGIWVNNIYLPKFYRHDVRLHHDPPAEFVEKFKSEKNICSKYIGIHGSYPTQMKTLWNHKGYSNFDTNKTLDDYSYFCWYESYMNWKLFKGEWRTKPKLCSTNPTWGGSFGTAYLGRQGQ